MMFWVWLVLVLLFGILCPVPRRDAFEPVPGEVYRLGEVLIKVVEVSGGLIKADILGGNGGRMVLNHTCFQEQVREHLLTWDRASGYGPRLRS